MTGLSPLLQDSLYYFGERRTDKSTSSKFQGIETPSQVSVLSLKGVTLGNQIKTGTYFLFFFLFFFLNNFWLCQVVATCRLSVAALHGLFIVMVSFIAKHRLQALGLQQLRLSGVCVAVILRHHPLLALLCGSFHALHTFHPSLTEELDWPFPKKSMVVNFTNISQ